MENEEVIHIEKGGTTYCVDEGVFWSHLPSRENNKKFLSLGNWEKWFTEYIGSEVCKTMKHYLALKRRILEIHICIDREKVDSVIKGRQFMLNIKEVKSSVKVCVKTKRKVLKSEEDIKKENNYLEEAYSMIYGELINIFNRGELLLQMHVYIKYENIRKRNNRKTPGWVPAPFHIRLQTAEFLHDEAIESQIEALKKTIILLQEKLNKEA